MSTVSNTATTTIVQWQETNKQRTHLAKVCTPVLKTFKSAIVHPYFVKPIGQSSANGVYVLSSFSGEKTFVVKPSLQEMGCLGNPSGNVSCRTGIPGGTEVVREGLAYQIQKIFNVSFGVPATTIRPAEHLLFGEAFGICHHFYTLLTKKFNITVNQTLSELCEKEGVENVQQLVSTIFKHSMSLVPQEKLLKVLQDLFLEMMKLEKPRLPKLLLLARNKIGTSEFEDLKILVKDLCTIVILSNENTVKSPLCSFQYFVPNTHTYFSFSPEELGKIPDVEMHKLVLDLIIFNTDRHLNNILFLFEKATHHFEIVLIDHGSSLPDPSVDSNATPQGLIDNARYEWLEYPQFAHPLAGLFAQKIAALEPEQFVEKVKQRLTKWESKLHISQLPEECLKLLGLNLQLLKTGIREGATVQEMGYFQMAFRKNDKKYGGEIVQVYREFLSKHSLKEVDWKAVDKKITTVLKTPLAQRLSE